MDTLIDFAKTGEKAEGLTSRFAIADYHIQKLREVEPHMFRVGESSHRADVMNRTYVQGLIGRLCLYNGGFTAAFTCILLVPALERFCKTREERLAVKK